jgi:adenosylcobinamide kinase / adenosylcobinamide-phosphate guanylyltransferase
MGRIVLITGAARSGKSTHALTLARSLASSGLYFLATGEALDDEMAERIATHRARRPAAFTTVEEPRNLTGALDSLAGRAGLVVLDCLTLWVSNLISAGEDGAAIVAKARELAGALLQATFPSVVVTDEVGAGIVPENPVARRFRDILGWTNQEIARAAEEVILMVAGYPLRVK